MLPWQKLFRHAVPQQAGRIGRDELVLVQVAEQLGGLDTSVVVEDRLVLVVEEAAAVGAQDL
jgi:hypothetical protein